MNPSPWSPQRIIEMRYQNALHQMMGKLFKAATGTDPLEFAAMLEQYARETWFHDWATAAASRMVTGLAVQGARTWREAARRSMHGQMIYNALQHEMQGAVGVRVRQIVADNAGLIQSVPQTLAGRITQFVEEEQQKGRRASEIAKDLRAQLPEMAASRLRLIARTETSKASTALTRARAEDVDLSWYAWMNSHDQRVRPAHKLMGDRGGVLITWNDPASPEALLGIKSSLGKYHAGECPNCRCYPAPLVRLEDIQWPHRVYVGGEIRMMPMAAFREIAGMSTRAAA